MKAEHPEGHLGRPETRNYCGMTVSRRGMLAASLGLAATSLNPRFGHAAAAPKPLPPGETRTIVLGVGGVDSEPAYLGAWAALYGGYFEALKKDGITVNVVPFPGGGADAILGLTSGRTQINYQSCENAIRAQTQGRDATIIYNAMPTPGVFIMARTALKDKVRSIADVKGLRWGVTAFGASGHTDSLQAAQYGGVPPADITWIALGGQAGLMPSVRQGRIDVFVATPQARALMLRDGLAYDLLDMFHLTNVSKIYPHGYAGLGFLSTRAYCDQNPFVAYKVVEALYKAVADAEHTAPATIAAKLPAQFQTPVLVPTIATMLEGFSKDGYTEPEAIAAMTADLLALKLIAKSVDPAIVVDNRFVEALRTEAPQ